MAKSNKMIFAFPFALMSESARVNCSSRFSALFSRLDLIWKGIAHAADTKVTDAIHKVEILETKISSADPRNILEKGYVLALDGRGVKLSSASGVRVGDRIQVMFTDGTVKGDVTEVDSKDN